MCSSQPSLLLLLPQAFVDTCFCLPATCPTPSASPLPFLTQAVDRAVEDMYFAPAMSRVATLGLGAPLSKGQLYDSYINHGESGALDIISAVRHSGALVCLWWAAPLAALAVLPPS